LANYGRNRRPKDAVADFLLGGNRKRLVVARLADEDGYSAAALVSELKIGRATVFEVLRALRAAGALEPRGDGYRLTRKTPLGRALRALVAALAEVGEKKVDRPPRPRRGRRRTKRRTKRLTSRSRTSR
jgi:biotin operon repressor